MLLLLHINPLSQLTRTLKRTTFPAFSVIGAEPSQTTGGNENQLEAGDTCPVFITEDPAPAERDFTSSILKKGVQRAYQIISISYP